MNVIQRLEELMGKALATSAAFAKADGDRSVPIRDWCAARSARDGTEVEYLAAMHAAMPQLLAVVKAAEEVIAAVNDGSIQELHEAQDRLEARLRPLITAHDEEGKHE